MNYRLGIFLGGLALFLLIGFFRPFIKNKVQPKRMAANLTFGAISSVLVAFLVPGGLFYISELIEGQHFGLFNHITLPYALEFIITLCFLDLAIYGQHVLSHHWSFLWRFHKVHHGDTFLDATSALRFHPGEILLSFIFKAALIVLFGLDKYAVITFEIILNFSAMFNHGNFSLPKSIEGIARKLIVTPDFHRVHHSPQRANTDTNFGFFFSSWDYIFKTYNSKTHNNQTFGLKGATYSGSQNIFKLLWAPAVTNESASKLD